MKTIEERAKEFADNFVVGDCSLIVDLIHKCANESYASGATEQRDIDIEKATDWLTNQFDGASRITIGKYTIPTKVFLENFRKAMRYE